MSDSETDYRETVEKMGELIDGCDAVLVGAASGMSAAAGFTQYYERDAIFTENFLDFERKYGFHNTFDGFYYNYRTPEERWAFIARSAEVILNAGPTKPYEDMREILEGREFHILTTNQDQQFNRVFPEEKISAIQGDWGFLQCSRPCHDGLYPSREVYDRLAENTDSDLRVPTDMLPRCPRCGALMEPWVRSRVFLEGERYRREYEKVNDFIRRNADGKLLLLEIGVGRMTPMFIQEPFWNLTYNIPGARYVTVNPRDAILPAQIAEKGLAVRYDIAKVLDDLVRRKSDE